MQDELEDHPVDYSSLNYEYWCDFFSIIEIEDENKSAASHIKKIASARSASIYDSNYSIKIPRKRKARTGLLRSNKTRKRRTITKIHSNILYSARIRECLR